MFWGLDPLKPSDIQTLPKYLIDAYALNTAFDNAFHQRGIQQMIYSNADGEEYFFPHYFILPQSKRLHEDKSGGPESPFMPSLNTLPKVSALMKTTRSILPGRIQVSSER